MKVLHNHFSSDYDIGYTPFQIVIRTIQLVFYFTNVKYHGGIDSKTKRKHATIIPVVSALQQYRVSIIFAGVFYLVKQRFFIEVVAQLNLSKSLQLCWAYISCKCCCVGMSSMKHAHVPCVLALSEITRQLQDVATPKKNKLHMKSKSRSKGEGIVSHKSHSELSIEVDSRATCTVL